MGMYKIQEEEGLQAVKECLRLGEQHYHEVVDRSSTTPYNVNHQLLELIHENGLLHLVTARDEQDNLIGYFCNMVSLDFITNTFSAKEVAIFILPEYRKGRVFLKLMMKMEEILKRRRVKVQLLAFQKGHSEQLPLKLGYKPIEIVYEKWLGE